MAIRLFEASGHQSPLTRLFAGIALGLCALLSACGQQGTEPAAPPAVRDIAFVGVSVLSMVGETGRRDGPRPGGRLGRPWPTC